MINITVDDKGVVQLLKRIEQKMGNMRPVMRVIAGIMHDAVEENFEKEGRPKWKPLKKSTIKQRERKGHWPGKILQVSGQLASSVTQKATSTSAIVGTNKKYAAIHQFGGEITQAARSELFVRSRYVRGSKKTGTKRGQFKKGTKEGRGFTFRERHIVIPARPFLKLDDKTLDEIRNKLLEYVTKV